MPPNRSHCVDFTSINIVITPRGEQLSGTFRPAQLCRASQRPRSPLPHSAEVTLPAKVTDWAHVGEAPPPPPPGIQPDSSPSQVPCYSAEAEISSPREGWGFRENNGFVHFLRTCLVSGQGGPGQLPLEPLTACDLCRGWGSTAARWLLLAGQGVTMGLRPALACLPEGRPRNLRGLYMRMRGRALPGAAGRGTVKTEDPRIPPGCSLLPKEV